MRDATKCAIYARYSSNNQRDASIEDQMRKCRQAAAVKGWVVLENSIYFDKAISGASITPRDDFKKMMRIATGKDCPFQRILVDDTSRVARNTRDALEVFSILNFYDIYVYYVAQGIDTSHETAEEMITVHGLIDSIQRRNISNETKRGIEGQILGGFSGGARRYGYRSEPVYNGKVDIYGNPEADGYRLKIVAEEAETIVRIFRLFGEDGYSAKKIANILNKELITTGKPRPPKGQYWSESSLLGSLRMGRGILSNELYAGRYLWNRLKSMRNPETGGKRYSLRERNEWVIVPRAELKIITEALWEKVVQRRRKIQKIINGRYDKGKILYSTKLLTGLMKCDKCGGNIVIVYGGRAAKYGCSNNWHKGEAVCNCNLRINKTHLEQAIVRSLNFNLTESSIISYITHKANILVKDRIKDSEPYWHKDALQDQLKRTDKEINNFIAAIGAGILSDTVREKLSEAENLKKDLQNKLSRIENSPALNIPEISTQEIREAIGNLHGILNSQAILGREFLSKIISEIRIVLRPGGGWHASIALKNNCKSEIICSSEAVLKINEAAA